jgi:putative SOS response-associated peptidase YedK
MLTINADDHPMFRLMHRPDPKRPPEKQDKRMVVILPPAQFEPWLDVPPQDAMEFMRQYPAEKLVTTPQPLPPKVPKAPRAPKPAPPEAPTLF